MSPLNTKELTLNSAVYFNDWVFNETCNYCTP